MNSLDLTAIPPEPCVAVQTKAQKEEDFRLFVPSGDHFLTIYKSIHKNRANDGYDLHNITLVDTPIIAHLQASVENDQVIFEMKDERVTRHGFSHRFAPVDASDLDTVAWVLSQAAHFYWELNRANSHAEATSQIQVEFYKLEANTNDLGYCEFVPIQPNLCQNHLIDFVAEEDAPYGFRLINETKHDLYPYLFYFDNESLSIISLYYTPGGTHTGEIPLKKKHGSLTLGYGSRDAFAYHLGRNQDVDVGFLKLFLSTKPIDLSHIPQQSPFELSRRGSKNYIRKKSDTWVTVLIPIILRRNCSDDV